MHEWRKHGTCTMNNPNLNSIFNYFNKTLALFKNYPIQSWLEEEDILPTSNKPYELARITKVIESKLGKRIRIECDKHEIQKQNCDNVDFTKEKLEDCKKIRAKVFTLLDSIDLCFDRITLKPIDCPIIPAKFRKFVCDAKVYYFRVKEDLDSLNFN